VRKIASILFISLTITGLCQAKPERASDIKQRDLSPEAKLSRVPKSEITASFQRGAKFIPDVIMVGFSPSTKTMLGQGIIRAQKGKTVILNEASLDRIANKFGVSEYEPLFPRHPSKLERIYKIKLAKGKDIAAAVEEYENNPNVEFAEPIFVYDICVVPSDDDYSTQWALPQINAPDAWDISTGSSNIVVAIIDTGVDYDHPDLAANIWVNSGEIQDNSIDDDENGFVDDYYGWDFVSVSASEVATGEDPGPRDNNPMDFHGHGTHCAGISGAAANNNTGLSHNVVGISWNSELMAVRAGYQGNDGDGHLTTADWAAAVTYAADNGADIISMSFGGYSSSSVGLNATNYALTKDCVLVAAAGNDNSQNQFFPACNQDVISVASSDSSDRKSWFSNFGSWVDVTAPGSSIYSTDFDDDYSFKSGTSMATPLTAGLVALIKSNEPTLNNDDIAQRVISTTANIDSLNPGFEGLLGSGRIDAYAALIDTSENHSPVLYNPWVTPSSGTESTNFEFTVDYYDPEGDPPDDNYRRVYISGLGYEQMTLKSGSADDGTYQYSTTLPVGSYSYMYFFADEHGLSDITDWKSGPYVYTNDSTIELKVDVSGGPVTNNIKIRFGYGPDFQNLMYQEWLAPELPQHVGIDSGQRVQFEVHLESINHDFTKWEFWDDEGNTWESVSSSYGFILNSGNIYATAFLDYTPQNYTIGGTVLREDSGPVPGGVDLTLSSSQQMMEQHTDDGNFSFSGVKGGVPVSVRLEASEGGYGFSPASLSYSNLKTDHTGESITAYATDIYAPTTSFLTVPSTINEDSSISFTWIGEDDVTEPVNLLYQYKLEGVDIDWSTEVTDTSKSYDLANGAYTFWVRAKDEAGNINQAPTNYTFVVNAAPRVVSATRINRSVWASRVTLEMPASPNHPNDIFVLLPEHAGISDSELIPVTIHRVDDINASGGNEIISDELGFTARISETKIGWLVTLPESIPPGQTEEYDIVWGKIKYFGWHPYVQVPLGFPDLYLGESNNSAVCLEVRLDNRPRPPVLMGNDELCFEKWNSDSRNKNQICARKSVIYWKDNKMWRGHSVSLE